MNLPGDWRNTLLTLYRHYVVEREKNVNTLIIRVKRKSDNTILHTQKFDTSDTPATDDELFDGYVRYMTSGGEYSFIEFIGDWKS